MHSVYRNKNSVIKIFGDFMYYETIVLLLYRERKRDRYEIKSSFDAVHL